MSVNSQNFAIALVPKRALAATTGAATTNGTAINMDLQPPADTIGFIGVLDVASTSTAVFKVQASSDGSNWYDIAGAVSPSLSAVGAYPIEIGQALLKQKLKTAQVAASATPGDPKYVRLVATTTGSSTVVYGLFSVFKLKQAPANGLVNGTDYTLLGD